VILGWFCLGRSYLCIWCSQFLWRRGSKILSCAIEAKADYIVSGDKHLKNIGKFKEIGIVNAREFLDILKYDTWHTLQDPLRPFFYFLTTSSPPLKKRDPKTIFK